MEKGAIISECGKYRFQLWRIWDSSKPVILWIMHNPSTADANVDDPTIRRIINFSKDWGYGGLYVGNIFPYRATNPKLLLYKAVSEILPEENSLHLNYMGSKCSDFILAYGNPVTKISLSLNAKFKVLKLTKKGNDCHPLYLKSNLQPFIYNENEYRNDKP